MFDYKTNKFKDKSSDVTNMFLLTGRNDDHNGV